MEDRPVYGYYWAATAQERREKLMPFFWGTWMKKHGHIYGNRSLGSTVAITNKHRFSYPGYSEILTGQAHDDVINSNDNKRNPYPSVLEFLKGKLGLPSERVAAFSSWETMNWIAEHKEGAIPINAGFEAYQHPDAVIRELSQLQFETLTPWGSVRHDIYTFRFAMAHLKQYKPRVLVPFLGRDRRLGTRRRIRAGAGSTAPDRRTPSPTVGISGSRRPVSRQDFHCDQHRSRKRQRSSRLERTTERMWRARSTSGWESSAPTRRSGVSKSNAGTVHQNQIAATLCRFLGIDYSEHNPNAGKPVE